ncbi:MAG: acetate--CoA ligase family protein [Thermoplasmataceae archaeon]
MSSVLLDSILKGPDPDEYTVKKLIREYGIPAPRSVLAVESTDYSKLKFPVVIKVSDPRILHKSDVGGVVTGIQNIDRLIDEIRKMQKKFPNSRILAEEMASPGLEIIIGLVKDINFGNVIMLGMGGIYTELYHDVVFRLTPIDRKDAGDMIDSTSIRIFEKSFRGITVNRNSVIDVLMSVSRLSVDIGESLEMLDLNPVIVNADMATAVDAKLILTRRTTS